MNVMVLSVPSLLKNYRIYLSFIFFMALYLFSAGFSLAAEPGTIVAEQHSGQCVDIFGGSRSEGERAIQWRCHGRQNQEFFFDPVDGAYQIRAKHSGKCLGVQGASTAKGASIVQMSCATEEYMLWRVDGSGNDRQVRVAHTNMCLNINGGSKNQGARLIQWPCAGATNEKWRINATLP